MGRLAPEKGVRWLLEALAHTPSFIRLHMAGDGPDRLRLVSQAKRLGLHDRVRFHGWVGEPERDRLLLQSRALVVPSTGPETFGLVVLEAFAMGRPVIHTSSGALTEVAGCNTAGVCVASGDTLALARAFSGLAGDYARAQALGLFGRGEIAHRFSVTNHLAALERIYEAAALALA